MKPSSFTYVSPTSVADAVAQLVDGGMDAKVIAGGQSLMPMLNLRIVAADRLIGLGRIEALRATSESAGEVRLGACITHEEIQRCRVPDPSNGLMPAVAARIAYQAVRNRGTIGGSLALADPSADWVTTMAALGATVEWEGPAGPQSCGADAFVSAAYMTRLDLTDLLTAIRIPRLHPEARWGTYKLCRKTGEFAHAMAMVIRSPGRTRAFLGATHGAPIRLPAAEGVLAGLGTWEASHARVLGDAFAADIAASGRELTDTHAWQSRTCLVRATQRSFGIEPAGVEGA